MKVGISLRPWIFACGVILLLFGLASIVASNISAYGGPIIVEYVGRNKAPGWEVSADFTKGDYIIADYRVDITWKDPPYEQIGLGDEQANVKFVALEVTSPEGNRTMFMHVLAIDVSGGTPVHGSLAKTVIDNSGGVIVHNVSEVAGVPADFIKEIIGGDPVEDLGGIAPCDGTYKLVIRPPSPPSIPSDPSEAEPKPPTYVALEKRPLQRPLALLLPVGAPVAVLGFVLVLWGNMSKKV